MRLRLLINGLLLGLIFSFFLGCKKKDSPAPVCDTSTLPDTISFSKNVLPVLAQCSLPACHSGSSPKGNLNLEPSNAYSQLTKKGSGYVNTTNPESSVLYSALISTSKPMPPTGPISPCSLETIRRWMDEGAKNN